MNLRNLALGVALAALAGAGSASAAISVSGSVGGAPTGATLENLDTLAIGSGGGFLGGSGITVNFTPDSAAVTGSLGGVYAAPFLSGGNGTGFGSPNQPNGVDATTYITSGSTGSVAGAAVEIVLPALEKYFGLLWGSVDGYNTLSFYNGSTLVGTVTGSDVTSSPNGDQGVNGTLYVNINSDLAFDRVVATSTSYAFEFDNLAFNEEQLVPEPMSLALFGTGLLGLGLVRRRRQA